MATTANVLGRNFRLGGVLAESFAVYFRQFVPFTVLALVVTLPVAFVDYLVIAAQGATIAEALSRANLWWSSADVVITIVANGLLQGAVCYGTFQDLRGQPLSIGAVLRRGIGLILPVLGVSILVGIFIIVGLWLLIVPGLILYTIYWVAVPVTVVERAGVMASLNRSADLTRGYRGRVFGVVIIFVILDIVLTGIVEQVLGLVAGIGTYTIVQWIVAALVYAFGAVIAAVSYYDLRAVKEGTDVEAIARVFD